jgi:diguanylate cyclase (GGDEF)-like protein
LPAEVERLGRLIGRPLGAQRTLAELLRDSTPSLLALDESYLALVQKLAKLVGEKDALVLRLSQTRDELAERAATDDLTGIANHRALLAAARRDCALAARTSQPIALILADVDHFKNVNDTYGHPTGDAVLRGVAKIIRDKARDTDVVARYGGEEFAIIMPETDAQGARVIAERIREAVKAEVFQTEMGPLKVTLSLGIATGPDHGYEKQHLIDLSDQCLYHAKRHGRNQSVTVAQMQGGKKLQVAEAG